MKKLLIALAIWMASASLNALPLGNPREASLHRNGIIFDQALNFRLGFYGDFNFNRHMRIKATESDIRRTEIFTEAAYLALNVCNRIDLFSTLGVTNIYLVSPSKAFGAVGFNIDADLRTKTDFSWSIGLRSNLWDWGCFGVGAEAQYFRARPRINYVHDTGVAVIYVPHRRLKYQEWQAGAGVAYRIPIASEATALVPYAGVRWAMAWFDVGNFFEPLLTQTYFNMRNQRGFGYAVGVTLVGCNTISVTAEARFVNENAFYVNSQFRF